jgi:aerobic-type carbon monoxide dehydrogenase small subunit (CoxS/CutS family)
LCRRGNAFSLLDGRRSLKVSPGSSHQQFDALREELRPSGARKHAIAANTVQCTVLVDGRAAMQEGKSDIDFSAAP